MNISFWNKNKSIQNDSEVNCKALPGDIVEYIGGYLLLIQRENDNNNIVIYADNPTISLRNFFNSIFELCKEKNLQYVRIEGIKKRWKYIKNMFPTVSVEEIKETRPLEIEKINQEFEPKEKAWKIPGKKMIIDENKMHDSTFIFELLWFGGENIQ